MTSTPTDAAELIADELAGDVPADVLADAERLARKHPNAHSGSRPSGIAAACHYAAEQLASDPWDKPDDRPTSQADIAPVWDISTVTLRKQFHALKPVVDAEEVDA